MAHPNEDLVREGYAAFGRGDVDALRRNFFAEDVRYHVPGKSPLGGDYEGVVQVLEWLGRQFELSQGTISAEVHDVVANDEHVVSLITVRGERAGRQLEDNSVQVFHIHDGKVSEVWSHPANLYARFAPGCLLAAALAVCDNWWRDHRGRWRGKARRVPASRCWGVR